MSVHDNVGRLQAFRTLYDLKFDGVTLLQRTIALADYGGVMDENIGACITPDKAVPLGVVEPFHFPLHFAILPPCL